MGRSRFVGCRGAQLNVAPAHVYYALQKLMKAAFPCTNFPALHRLEEDHVVWITKEAAFPYYMSRNLPMHNRFSELTRSRDVFTQNFLVYPKIHRRVLQEYRSLTPWTLDGGELVFCESPYYVVDLDKPHLRAAGIGSHKGGQPLDQDYRGYLVKVKPAKRSHTTRSGRTNVQTGLCLGMPFKDATGNERPIRPQIR